MTPTDLRARLARVAAADAAPTADHDLNPDWTPPAGRVLRQAGVLIAVRPDPAGARLILTKRSSALKHHPGQIAFPGGKVEPVDDGPLDAALREAREEVGLDPAGVEVLGTLPRHETVTGYDVTPVIGWVADPFQFVPEAGEVEEVFEVPFAHVADPARYRVEGRRWRGTRRHYYVVPWGPYYIWGATARILRALADRLHAP